MASGVKAGDAVLVPSYHCESMIEPFAWLGAELIPFRIREDLSIDLEDIARQSRPGIRSILVPQYFGHIRSIEPLSRLAAERGWTVIEDCAHAFFSVGPRPLSGMHSDYVVASLPKFFPVLDGGVLASGRHDVSGVRTHPVGVRHELKGIVDMVEYAEEYGRRSPITKLLMSVLSVARRAHRTTSDNDGRSELPASRHGGVTFEPEHLDLSTCRTSRRWASSSRRDHHASARRSHWTTLRDALVDLPGVRLPIADLGAGDVPYVFAMDVEGGQTIYPELKRLGVPTYRWETCHPEVDPSHCDNARRFFSDLVQLPCHQSLTASELEWIIETVRRVVRAFG